MQTADVVIIGGGVIGASVAYHLGARGVRDLLVLGRGAGPGEHGARPRSGNSSPESSPTAPHTL